MSVKNIGKESIHNLCASQVICTLSSLVKELVENSIDAEATGINIKLVESGNKLIEVNDNGKGIKKINFENVCARHATSKITEFTDIQSNLTTLGFRGEALNSLCMLSDVVITTKNDECEHGYSLKFNKFGALIQEEAIGRSRGTTVSCHNIFKHIPIRKKDFIKNMKTQLSQLLVLIQQYSIIYYHIKFSIYNIMTSNGQTKHINLLMTQGSNNLLENFYSLFGKKNVGKLIEFNINADEKWKIKGYISDTNSGRRDKDLQFYYMNSRPIHVLKNINKIINTIYREFNSRLYPILILDIISSIENIDINVTPDKREVFFTFENEMIEEIKIHLTKLLTPKKSNFIDTQIDQYFLKANNLTNKKTNLQIEQNYEKELHNINNEYSNYAKNEITEIGEDTNYYNGNINNTQKQMECNFLIKQERNDNDIQVENKQKTSNLRNEIPTENSFYGMVNESNNITTIENNQNYETTCEYNKEYELSNNIHNNNNMKDTIISNGSYFMKSGHNKLTTLCDYANETTINLKNEVKSTNHNVYIYHSNETEIENQKKTNYNYENFHIQEETEEKKKLQYEKHLENTEELNYEKHYNKTNKEIEYNLNVIEYKFNNDMSSNYESHNNTVDTNYIKVNKQSINDEEIVTTSIYENNISNKYSNAYKEESLKKKGNENAGAKHYSYEYTFENVKNGIDTKSHGNQVENVITEIDNTSNVYEYKIENIESNDKKNEYEYQIEPVGNTKEYEYKLDISVNEENKLKEVTESNDKKGDSNYSLQNLKENIKNSCIKTLPMDINMYINREKLKEGYDYDQIHVINLTNSKKIKNIVFHKTEKEEANKLNDFLCLTDDKEQSNYKNIFNNELSINETEINTSVNQRNDTEDIDFNTIDENQKDLYFKSNLFEKLKICGQFNKGFIISKINLLYFGKQQKLNETEDKNVTEERKNDYALFIIDQHAADEKSNFEKYNKTFTMNSQKLINKINLHLSPSQIQIIEKNYEIFLENGFEVSISEELINKKRKIDTEKINTHGSSYACDSNKVTRNNFETDNNDDPTNEDLWTQTKISISSLPVFNGKILEVTDFMSLLHHLTEHPISYDKSKFEIYIKNKRLSNKKTDTWFNYNFPRPQKVWRILASKACRNAVMVGKVLNIFDMIKIKKKLSHLRNPWNCPHGRPTIKYIINNIDVKNCFQNYYLKLYEEIENLVLTKNYEAYKYIIHNHTFFLIMSTKPLLGPLLKFQ